MGSSKNNHRTINDCTQIINRLNQALSLGTRDGRKWKCSDIQVQRQVVRSISAFIDSVVIRADSLHHPSLKDTVSDALSALVWILEHTNTVTLSLAADVALKLVAALPHSILKSRTSDLVGPLSSLIPCRHGGAAISGAKALSLALSDAAGPKNEKTVWDVLVEKEVVRHCIGHLQTSPNHPMEMFPSMASLLGTILRRFPRSRFIVWSDDNLMRTLNEVLENPDSPGKVEALQLLSAIALCGTGAKKLVESGESLIKAMVRCMGSSQPQSVQVEAFRLAQYLATNEERYSKMRSLCCEPMVEAIISGMSKASSVKSGAEISVALEACRLASITRWGGDHHSFFWKHGIGNVLLDLLLEDSRDQLDRNSLSLEKQFFIAVACRNSNHLPSLRNYLWDILGWLAIHSEKGFKPDGDGHKLSVYVLVLSACSAFVDAIHKHQKLCQVNLDDTLRSEPAMRAALMMVYSPCEYIASKARSVLSELLKMYVLEHFLSVLKYIVSDGFDRQQLVIYAMALACYVALPEPRSWVLKFSGLKVLLTLVRRCISRGIDAKKQSESRYWHGSFYGQTCCDIYSEEWEGNDTLLFYSLWGLAELIKHLSGTNNGLETASEVVQTLREICSEASAPGARWFASYALSFLGLYGFPRKLARRVEKILRDTYYTDTRLVLKSGEPLSVHSVILAVRCPSLLRLGDKTSDSTETSGEFQREIRFSGCVDRQVLEKFLDFVYLGYLQAGEEHTSLLKALAKRCDLPTLHQMLNRRRPIWGTPYPTSDLSLALGPLGHRFSDVVFETKKNEPQQGWKCNFCSSPVPHIHAHKVIMTASSDYFRAMFTSGMQESLSQTMKLDLSWKAMVKLISWAYTDELPNPPTGCLWNNLSDDEKLSEIEPYLELCSTAKSLCIEDVEEACSSVVAAHLDSDRRLSIKTLEIAFGFALWNLVEVALSYAAPYYRQLYNSGELEDLDDAIVDMVRSASVQYAQDHNQD